MYKVKFFKLKSTVVFCIFLYFNIYIDSTEIKIILWSSLNYFTTCCYYIINIKPKIDRLMIKTMCKDIYTVL